MEMNRFENYCIFIKEKVELGVYYEEKKVDECQRGYSYYKIYRFGICFFFIIVEKNNFVGIDYGVLGFRIRGQYIFSDYVNCGVLLCLFWEVILL